ncbi:hypothetical protein [Candidatus Mesenet endosymbiont of Phosphuga atrata]|uniref:hypothetical protein n=1 Tax=Candidatus Mesenet endosymbiont of Phosphuga atrata TaxID=3066221 RepID=UPI0030CAA81C
MRSANVKSLTRTKIFSEDNIKIKVHYDDLSGEKLQKAIDEVKNNFNGFKTLLGLKKDGTLSELQLYIYNNEDSYHKNTESTMGFGYFSPRSGSMYICQTTYEPGGITLESAMMIAQNQRVLPKRDLIELDNNLQVNLYYNNLSDKQLEAAKQQIRNAFDEYEELYGIKKYDTTKTIGVFIHDNRQDFLNYGYTYANYCVNQVDRESTNVANAYHFIEHDSSRSLRKQVSFALSHYNGGHSFHVLPDKEEVIEFPDFNIQVKLGTNSLNDEQIEITKQEIIDALKYVKVDAPIEIKINKFNDLDNLDDDILVSLLKKVRPHESYNHESAKKALEDPIIQRDMPILSSIGDALQKTQVLLSNVETVKFPRYNLEIDLYYRDLDEHQIWRAKQEIKNTIYDFNESFDLKPSNTVHKSRILFYDTWDDYANYTGATHGGHADGTNAFCSLTYGYGVLRHEFMHNIVSYTGVDSDGALPELLNHNIVGHIQRGVYPTRDDELYDGAKHIDQYLKNSKFNVDERVYVTIEFFQEMYPGLINSIFYDRKSYGSALEFFKAKFPDMVSHIPSSDVDFYKNYDEKLLNKIFENKGVKQKLLDFIEVKLAEKKYIDEVRDLNAFRVLKGDHIGTDKNTDEEYYTGMIVDDRGEIGAFSPVEYSFLRKGIKVFNHATQDSIVIPKKYHNLKLVKVDSNYKLAFCDQHGSEYRDTRACKNKTKDLLYTDDAKEAFTLVDLHSLQGITGKEENLDKIFSIKPTNSKSIISIYDDRKEVGSFINEVGYVNRNKFYFKDSTDFKTYDENRALVIVTKEDDEHRLFLADGNYIDDDNKLLKQSIKLSGNEIDVDGTYCKDREYGQFLEREDTLLFRYGPGPENEKTITLSDNLEVKLYYDNLSDDVLQKIIDQIKEVDSKYPNLKALVEDNVSKPLQFYIYDTRNSYRAHTGSTKEHGHFDHSSNTIRS